MRTNRLLSVMLAVLLPLGVTLLATPPRRMTGWEIAENGTVTTRWSSWRADAVEVETADYRLCMTVDRHDPSRAEVRQYVRDADGRLTLSAVTPVVLPHAQDGLHHSYTLQPFT